MSINVLLSSWLPVFAWAALIFGISSIPSLDTGWGLWDFLLRKTAHMVEFGVLTLLVLRAVGRTWPAVRRDRALAAAALSALLYAVSDEVHQAYVPGRGPSAADVAVDGVGIAGAIGLAHWRRRALSGRAS